MLLSRRSSRPSLLVQSHLLDAVVDCDVANPEYLSDVVLAPCETVGPACDQKARGADASGPPALHDPVPLHPSNDPQCRQGNGIGLLSQLQVASEPRREGGGSEGKGRRC